ncbi:MAG: ComEC/Rec2 family competence protein [Candidatus Amoebophilus sp.]
MSFWSAFPFVRITIFFIGGILWAYYYGTLSYKLVMLVTIVLATSYLILIIIWQRARLYFLNSWLGIIGLSNIFFAGCLCLLNYQGNANLVKLQHQVDNIKAYVAVALEDAIIKEDRLSVTVAIQQAHIQGKWENLTGKVHLLVDKPSAATIQYGEVYMIVGKPHLIAAPRNPEEFNYKRFLSHKHIYYQHQVYLNYIRKITYAPPSSLQAICLRIRKFCKEVLTQHMEGLNERGIALALVLGIKDELNAEVRDAYASAGTMHILAVSGLHVGILYWLLSVLLYRRKKSQTRSKWLGSILICGALWIYAGMTGLTPSVVRATLMFSFVIVARLLGRAGNIYNLLSVSAFLLLLINPLLIFSVSFQLSYLAVLGIIYLQPKIYGWFNFKNIVLPPTLAMDLCVFSCTIGHYAD